jgi:chemotaxis response regulator CheB
MAVVLNQVRVGVLDNDPLALRMFRTLFASRPDITLIWLERHPSVAVQSLRVSGDTSGCSGGRHGS